MFSFATRVSTISETFDAPPRYSGNLMYQVANASSSVLTSCAIECARLNWCLMFVFNGETSDCFFMNAPLMGSYLGPSHKTYMKIIQGKGDLINSKGYYRINNDPAHFMLDCYTPTIYDESVLHFAVFEHPAYDVYIVTSGTIKVRPGTNQDGFEAYMFHGYMRDKLEKHTCTYITGPRDANDVYEFTCDFPIAGTAIAFEPFTPMSKTEGVCDVTVYGFRIDDTMLMYGKW
ncbi:Uncharacterised protein g6459 [Pycnogonum litorale]